MVWFEHPPVCVIDWAKPGKVRQVSSVEAAAEELLKWPKTKKRDKAATLLADAMGGMADIQVSAGINTGIRSPHHNELTIISKR